MHPIINLLIIFVQIHFMKGFIMSIKERIQDLCKAKHVSMNSVETTLGFGKGYLSKLGTTKPNSEKLEKIANYFNVSLDYIITGKVQNQTSTPSYKKYENLRDRHGFKNADVARKANIPKSTFSDWKSGRSKPGLQKLQKIANIFDVNIDYLITENNSSKNISSTININDELKHLKTLLTNKNLRPLYYDDKLADEDSLDLLSKHIDLMLALIQNELKTK